MICPICNSSKTFLKFKSNLNQPMNEFQVANNFFGMHGNVYKCRECNLGWVHDKYLTGQLLSNYQRSTLDEVYEKEYKGRKKTANALIKKIKKIKPTGKILDIGCYTGIFLQTAQETGYIPFGIEASLSFLRQISIAICQGFKVKIGMLFCHIICSIFHFVICINCWGKKNLSLTRRIILAVISLWGI